MDLSLEAAIVISLFQLVHVVYKQSINYCHFYTLPRNDSRFSAHPRAVSLLFTAKRDTSLTERKNRHRCLSRTGR